MNDIINIVKEFIKQEPELVKYMVDNKDSLHPDDYKVLSDFYRAKKDEMKFQEYITSNHDYFILRVKSKTPDEISFYIHPNTSGMTMDCRVRGNRIIMDSLSK